MRRVRIEKFCEPCWIDGEREEPATHSFTVAISVGEARPVDARVVDACEVHAKLVEELRLLARDHGSPLVDGYPTAEAPRRRPPSALNRSRQCPVCGQDRSSLAKHVWDVHIGKTERPPSPVVCPDCGFTPADDIEQPQASVARHRMSIHGLDPVAEAVKAYERHQVQPVRPQPQRKGSVRCPECGQGFSRPQGLGMHRLKTHGVPGGKRG